MIDRSLGGEVSHDGDFMIFEGNRYSRKGFLFKSFAMSAVVRRMFQCLLSCLSRNVMMLFRLLQEASNLRKVDLNHENHEMKSMGCWFLSVTDHGWSEAHPVRAGEV